jgi:hypothetical protein
MININYFSYALQTTAYFTAFVLLSKVRIEPENVNIRLFSPEMVRFIVLENVRR